MREIEKHLTVAGRTELIRARFGEDITSLHEMYVEQLMLDAFLAGWEHGVESYLNTLDKLKKGEKI